MSDEEEGGGGVRDLDSEWRALRRVQRSITMEMKQRVIRRHLVHADINDANDFMISNAIKHNQTDETCSKTIDTNLVNVS